MLKIISAILMLFGFAVAGRCAAAYQLKRVQMLEKIIMMLSTVETRLRYDCLPIPDLLRMLSENSAFSEFEFIKQCREKVCFGEAFSEAWSQSVKEQAEMCRLLSSSCESLVALGEAIGSTDLEGQLSCCEYFKSVFLKDLALQEEKSKKYSKLFPPLGLMLGISAAIIII